MLLWSFPILTVSFWLLPATTGQTTDTTCLPFYAWTNNSRKQSPCQVAATLLAVCGSYSVAALPVGSHYTGPSLASANPCECNTVVYSLMSACGACQGRTYQTWSTWSGNCPTVSINAFPKPIPPKTFVPGWAYLDVKANDMFNETAAKLSANSTAESTALPTPTSTSTVASTTSIKSAPAKTSPAASTSTSSAAHDNMIIGGIVGGTVGLAILLGFVHWVFTQGRRRRVRLSSPIGEVQSQGPATTDMQQYLANTVPLAASSINTSLASPSTAQFSNLSAPGSTKSEARSNV